VCWFVVFSQDSLRHRISIIVCWLICCCCWLFCLRLILEHLNSVGWMSFPSMTGLELVRLDLLRLLFWHLICYQFRASVADAETISSSCEHIAMWKTDWKWWVDEDRVQWVILLLASWSHPLTLHGHQWARS